MSDNLGDDSYGEPKRIVSLLGVGDTSPWAWNGSQSNLTDQVRKSMFATMHGAVRRKVSEEDVFAITDYLQSLSPPPGIDVARGRVDTLAVERGREVFRSSGCVECHVPPEYTLPDVRPTGLADAERSGELNPPSLRGVSQQIRWLHDGRATTLRDVFTVFHHHGSEDLTPREIEDLESFLRSL
jgi:cytochrome c peroxidase